MAQAGSEYVPVHLGHSCLVCKADAWLPLPIPKPGRSMISDGMVVPHSLKKCSCSNCGLVRHVDEQRADDVRNYFGASYSLSDHQPNIGFEGGRQRHYAEWIASTLGGFRPDSILELGCGNGSLLSEMMTLFPSAKFLGLESSEPGVRWAQLSGLPVHRAYITEEGSIKGFNADLVVSVNVMEHTLRPVDFLRAARAAVNHGGLISLVCPDGSEVGSELLFFDHLYSLSPSNLASLVREAGLWPVHHRRSPPELAGFQMIVAATNPQEKYEFQGKLDFASVPVAQLHATRAAYLAKWKDLDNQLCDAFAGYRTIAVFGVGEMARLIRAYAPSAWDLMSYFVIDDPNEREFFGRPVIPYKEWNAAPGEAVLLAVAPQSVTKISARLIAAGHRVLELNDLHSARGS